ncbi:MAG: ABC transporter permease [Phycisphaerae bacterium]
MKRILRIARREYAETVRTKMFFVGVLLMPVLIVLLALLVGRDEASARPARTITVSDRTGRLWEGIEAAFQRHNEAFPQRRLTPLRVSGEAGEADSIDAAQEERVREGKVDFHVAVDAGVLAGEGAMRLYSRRTVAVDMEDLSTVERLLNQAIFNRRCAEKELDPVLLAELRRRVPLRRVQVGRAGATERAQSEQDKIIGMMTPFFFMFLMFMGVFGMGQHMLTGLIEEKSSRVIEVILSAVSPFELLAGKVLGLGAIGLTAIGLWLASALGAARWRGIEIDLPAALAAYLMIYYVLGFLMFSAILGGIGSVCNTIKDAQALMMPLTLLFMLPMMAWFHLVKSPDGTLSRVLSFVPPMTPLVMALRLSANPETSTLETWATIAVLAAFVPCVIWAMAKVFRTGILLYGKRPGLREVIRWLRQS